MSAAELEDFYVHTVAVRTLTGSGAWGDTYEDHAGVRCFVDDSRTMVRDEQGTEVVSSSTLTCPVEYAGIFAPGSTVALPHREATVIGVAHAESGPLDLPDHIEVALT